MKTKLTLLFVGILFALSSCNVTQKITVVGRPGTTIYDTNDRMLGTIENTGKTTLEISRNDGYYAFLQAQAPGSNILVPFALDYQDCRRQLGQNIGTYTGFTLAIIGSVCGITAAVASALEADDISRGFAFVTLGTVGAGVGLMLPCLLRSVPDPDFNYTDIQKTNEDLIK
ncbi:MAG: hypothetical protein U0L47_01515 [Paludibacteraceae bacterium]|nr:hypothetical protein [Paludibacteraceae bacterium]